MAAGAGPASVWSTLNLMASPVVSASGYKLGTDSSRKGVDFLMRPISGVGLPRRRNLMASEVWRFHDEIGDFWVQSRILDGLPDSQIR
jgi:hypothetical protein